MNKKMKEIYAKIQKLNDLANEYLENGDVENAEKTINQIEALEREYVIAEKLYNREKGQITDEDIDKSLQDKKASGFAVIAKLMKGKGLTDAENAIVVEGEPAESGTNYLIPEDVRTEIRELRKSYKSAKELVNIIPVTTLSGLLILKQKMMVF
ncbi:MAG: phage major capsid protein [Clostridia bacterium]